MSPRSSSGVGTLAPDRDHRSEPPRLVAGAYRGIKGRTTGLLFGVSPDPVKNTVYAICVSLADCGSFAA